MIVLLLSLGQGGAPRATLEASDGDRLGWQRLKKNKDPENDPNGAPKACICLRFRKGREIGPLVIPRSAARDSMCLARGMSAHSGRLRVQ